MVLNLKTTKGFILYKNTSVFKAQVLFYKKKITIFFKIKGKGGQKDSEPRMSNVENGA